MATARARPMPQRNLAYGAAVGRSRLCVGREAPPRSVTKRDCGTARRVPCGSPRTTLFWAVSLMRPLVLTLATAIVLAAPIARAEGTTEVLPSGHLQYAIGGAFSSGQGFRMGLDASLGVAFADDRGAWTVAPSIVTGFGAYPTYVSLDLGRVAFAGKGEQGGLAGVILTLGPAARIDPGTGAGGELSLRAYLLALQVGVRGIFIGTNGSEAQLQATIGIGIF